MFNSNKSQQVNQSSQERDTQTVKEQTKSSFQVTKELTDILDKVNQQVGFQLYKGVRIEQHGAYWAIYTVSDEWYSLESYVKERLVKIVIGYYKQAEGGLNNLAEVSLEDAFGTELASGYYGSGGMEVKIYK